MDSAPESGSTPTPNVVLSAIADDHRRAVLRSLHRAGDGGMTTDELVEEVAALAGNAGPLDPERRRRARTQLHHVHLPRLAEDGLVVRDGDRVHAVTGELSRELLAAVAPYETPD